MREMVTLGDASGCQEFHLPMLTGKRESPKGSLLAISHGLRSKHGKLHRLFG